jgi:multiple sugar transport system substrate-binding protein
LSGSLKVQASGGDSEIAALKRLIDAFKAANSGVQVELVPVAQQGEHIAKLSTAFAGGNPPDVFLLNYRRFGVFAASGVIAPAEAALAPLKKDDFYAAPLEAFSDSSGTLLCLPQNISSSVVYLNLTLLQRARIPLPANNWTWAQMENIARQLSGAKIKAIGFETGTRTVAPFVWSAGGEYVDSTQAPTKVTLDNEPGRATLGYLSGLQKYGIDAKARAAEDPADTFGRGQLGMFIDSRRAVPGFRKNASLDFDVRPLPVNKTSTSLLASDGYCVAKSSKNLAAAQAFARFAAGTAGATVLSQAGRTVPVLKSLATSPVFLDPAAKPKSAQVWLDVIPTLRRLPNVAAENEAEEAADEILDQYFAGKLSLDAATERIEKDSAAVFAQKR